MDFKIAVIGAGVVGLAITRELTKYYENIIVIEKNEKSGQETSSRNSEVIHSGIYYPQNSLKAELCVKGQKIIYNYCDQRNIDYKKCGKYIIATNKEQEQKLEQIYSNAIKNGVSNLKIISKNQFNKAEPNVFATKAIHFPESGIIDSYYLIKSLEAEILNSNNYIVYNTEVVNILKIKRGYQINTRNNNEEFSFSSEIIINSSGLNSEKMARNVGLSDIRYTLHFWKGEYFSIGNGKNKLVNSLIYPVPNDEASLGIHVTKDLGNGLKLGPNAYYVSGFDINYKVNEENKIDFFNSAKKYLPFLEIDDLRPDQAGIRPKLSNNKNEFRDFIIKNETENGLKNFINLIGIESPGLTACLAIADYVKNIII